MRSIGKWHRASIHLVAPCQYVWGMTDETPAREQDKFVLRLPDGMRDRLKAAAEANKRSMNAEIITRLEGSFLSSKILQAAGADTGAVPPKENFIAIVDAFYEVIGVMDELQGKGELTAENLKKQLAHSHRHKILK